MHWNTDWSSDYQEVNILDKCGVYDWIVARLCESRRLDGLDGLPSILDLGSGSGYLSSLLMDWEFTNVDPYPPIKCYGKVIKRVVPEYLEECSRVYDVVVCLFSLHHFYYPGWLGKVERVLKSGGECFVFSVDRGSQWFGDGEFNRVFFSRGHWSFHSELISRMSMEIKDVWGWIEDYEMVVWLRGRGWSHLREMSSDLIEGMVVRVPNGRFRFHLRIQVYRYGD